VGAEDRPARRKHGIARIEGTDGEKKLAKTILNPYANLGLRNSTDLPTNIFQTYRQVIFEKRHTDIFQHARAERLITEISQAGFVLCGAGVSKGVVQAAVGLRNRGFSVVLASDAVLDLNDPRAKMAYEQMQAKGVLFLTTRRIIRPAKASVSVGAFRTASRIQR
jgi:isochorismate hydrolase